MLRGLLRWMTMFRIDSYVVSLHRVVLIFLTNHNLGPRYNVLKMTSTKCGLSESSDPICVHNGLR